MRPFRSSMWAVYDRYNHNLFYDGSHAAAYSSKRAAQRFVRENNLGRLARIVRYNVVRYM